MGISRTPKHGELRNTKGRAAMNALHDWLVQAKAKHLPSSPAGQAIAYGLAQWPHLEVFLGLPGVPVDNNQSERLLRVIARGRASYLFVGHDHGGTIWPNSCLWSRRQRRAGRTLRRT